MEFGAMRDRLSLTQAGLGALMGVSQAAVAQYESGRRSPMGAVHDFYDRLAAAIATPVVDEQVGRRSTTMPAIRWRRVIDAGRVEPFALPVRLDWSPRVASRWVYGDVEHRRELYRLLIDTGEAIDVMTYVDVDELAAWAPELRVSRVSRPVLERLLERTATSRV